MGPVHKVDKSGFHYNIGKSELKIESRKMLMVFIVTQVVHVVFYTSV